MVNYLVTYSLDASCIWTLCSGLNPVGKRVCLEMFLITHSKIFISRGLIELLKVDRGVGWQRGIL